MNESYERSIISLIEDLLLDLFLLISANRQLLVLHFYIVAFE